MKQALAILSRRSERIELVHDQRVVRYRGRQTQLGDLSFRLLALLAGSAPDGVTYERIAKDVWDAHVTRETLKQRVKLLRDELRQLGVPETAIEAIRNSGYRLTIAAAQDGASRGFRVPLLVTVAAASAGLLLLVFQLASNPHNNDHQPLTIAVAADVPDSPAPGLAGKMVRDGLVRNLSRLDDIVVIDAAQAGTPARSDLLARVAIYPSGEGMRVAISLAESSSGFVLWAENYAHDPALIERTVLHAANNINAYAFTLGAELGDGGYQAQSAQTRGAYIKALRWWRSAEESRLLDAQASLKSMLRSEPGFHLALSLLARVEADLVISHGHPRSLVIDDENAVARLLAKHGAFSDFRYSMARIQLALGHKEKALAELRRARPGMPFLVRDIQALERELENPDPVSG